jgi:hypothetical protein
MRNHMLIVRLIVLSTALSLSAPAVRAEQAIPAPPPADAPVPQVTVSAGRDPEWASYRHAYKSAAWVAPFLRDRPLIQAHMQVRPLAPTSSLDGLLVHLASAHTQLDIPVDPLGRMTLPMDKQAYQDDAVLSLNRQKGLYYFSGRFSIRERADGIYPVADLRTACEQLIDAQRDTGYSLRLFRKRCAAAKLIYPLAGDAPDVVLRLADGRESPLPVTVDTPFEDGSMGRYQVVKVGFAAVPAGATVVARTLPLGVGTEYQ